MAIPSDIVASWERGDPPHLPPQFSELIKDAYKQDLPVRRQIDTAIKTKNWKGVAEIANLVWKNAGAPLAKHAVWGAVAPASILVTAGVLNALGMPVPPEVVALAMEAAKAAAGA